MSDEKVIEKIIKATILSFILGCMYYVVFFSTNSFVSFIVLVVLWFIYLGFADD